MALNLDPARRSVAALMVDECLIERDPQSTSDDLIDPVTMRIVSPAGDVAEIYDGPCFINRPTNAQPRPLAQVAGQQLATDRYSVAIPWDSPDLHKGDRVTITRANGDATLKGKKFSITGVTRGSILVWRVAEMNLEETPYG